MKALTKLLGVLLLSLAFAVQGIAGEMDCPPASSSSVVSEKPVSNPPVASSTTADIEFLPLRGILFNMLKALPLLF